MLLLLLACPSPPVPPAPTGEGIFRDGCPVAGQSVARPLGAGEHFTGPDALATAGDIVLYNTQAAYAISNPDAPHTYYHYGGIPIDAVGIKDCTQGSEEKFGELGFVVGQLDLLHFESSHLRQFHGKSIRVISDGSDGKAAVVEVTGTDDRFWLIEMELLRRLLQKGTPGTLGDLWGLEMTVRYALEPDSPVLQVEVVLSGGTPGQYLVGSVVFPSDLTVASAAGWSSVSAGGLSLASQVPWLQLYTPDGTGAYAIAMPGANLGRTEISGVTALVDINQALSGLKGGGRRTCRHHPVCHFQQRDGPGPRGGPPLHGDGRTGRWNGLYHAERFGDGGGSRRQAGPRGDHPGGCDGRRRDQSSPRPSDR